MATGNRVTDLLAATAKWSLAFLGLAAIGLALVYWLLPPLTHAWLSAHLDTYGVADFEIDMERPRWSSAHINGLSLSYDGYRLAAKSVDVSYSLAGLWSGRISSVSAADVSLWARDAPDTGRAPPNPRLFWQVWQELPVDKVDLQTIAIKGLPASAIGSLHIEHTATRADFSFNRVHMALELRPDRSFTAHLSDGLGSRLDVEGDISRLDQIDASIRATLTANSVKQYADLGGVGGRLGFALALRARWNATVAESLRSAVAKGTFQLSAHDDDVHLGAEAVGTIRLDDGRVRFEIEDDRDSHSTLAGRSWRTTGHVETDLADRSQRIGFGLRWTGQALDEPTQVEINGHVDLGAGHIDGTGNVDLLIEGIPLRVEARGRVQLASFDAKYDGALDVGGNPIPFTGTYANGQRAASIAANHRFPVDKPLRLRIPAGYQLTATGRIMMDLAVDSEDRMTMAARLEDGHVQVDSLSAHGLVVDIALQSESRQPPVGTVAIRAETIEAGVRIHAVAAAASMDGSSSPLAHISTLQGMVLGGRFSARPFDYRPDVATAVELDIEGLDVTRILAVQGELLTGTGTLDGHLPIKVNAGRATIADGLLQARAPGGRVQFSGSIDHTIAQQVGRALALEALRDYRYHHLMTTVDYAADGTLNLGLRLEGTSPNVQGGRPVHYNANVTQHLPTLLESLKLASSLDVRVRRHVARGARQ